ncbi:MAG TPA: AAA family ATPase, partial [Polyangia bacterium]|nr:AAA family ATPase [Polyangia bacterium]
RARAAAAAEASGARFVFIETQVPSEVARARLAARRTRPSTSDATEALLDDFLGAYEPPGTGEPGRRLTVDMGASVDAAVSATLRQLAEAGIAKPTSRVGS